MLSKEEMQQLTDEYYDLKQKRKIEQAMNLYFTKIFPNYKDILIKENKGVAKKPYDILFSTLGRSPQTSVISYLVVKPTEKIVLVGTEKTIKQYMKYVVNNTDLKDNPHKYQHITIDTNIDKMYEKIADEIKQYKGKNIIFDMTGGKKTMSAVAMLIAVNGNIDISYIDQDGFGTEKIVKFKNPMFYYGDLSFRKAVEQFNATRYNIAKSTIDNNWEHIKDKITADKLKYFIEIYENWHSFDIKEAKDKLTKFIGKYDNIPEKLKIDMDNNLGALSKIQKNMNYEIMNYYFSAERFKNAGQFDIGVFLLYRTIEKLFSVILKEEYNINNSAFTDKQNSYDFIEFKKIGDSVYKEGYNGSKFPFKMGLMDSAIMLRYLKNNNIEHIDLKELKGIVELRNESNFTHGNRILAAGDYNTFDKITRKCLSKYLESIDINLENIQKNFKFPKLKEDML